MTQKRKIGMALWGTIPLVSIIGIVYALCGCQGIVAEEQPNKIVEWHSVGGGWAEWGRGGNSLYGRSAKSPVIDVWQWRGSMVEHCIHRDMGEWEPLQFTVLSDKLCVSYVHISHTYDSFVRVTNLDDGLVVQHWPKEENTCYHLSRASANGEHVAFWSEPDVKSPDFASGKVRVGMLAPKADAIDWVAAMTYTTTTANIGGVVPSDDGVYVAFAGWDHGGAVVNVLKKEVLWQNRPQDEVCFADIAFSPDNKLVYAGGGEGCVYGMKVQDGEIVSRWWASSTGKSEYGHRITTISVSPDGRFVAAGTGPEGFVYLFSTKDGQRRVLNHGGSTILITSFSPDSQHLATFAAGQIKIWTTEK